MSKSFEKWYNCRFVMYMNRVPGGIKSKIYGKNLIDAIIHRNQYAILSWVKDEDGTEYICNEHDEPDSQGYYNHYWTNTVTGKVLYDENAVEYVKPVVEPTDIKTTETNYGYIAPDGLFYECSFEQHVYLADYIHESGMLPEPTETELEIMNRDDDYDTWLESRGWVKLTCDGIKFKGWKQGKLTKLQKETIVDYYLSKSKKTIRVFNQQYTYEEFDQMF